ncbi:unnamed protein product [Dibothriocephalus latus]|uniref:Uncharacterized protein n=1 Tax=Dibothriocephalus latus TaxID=60516 RepID=A0A3P7PCV4_DIBLA|nr:unnamed protein product [Dibothriocephalus latus]
MSGATFLLLVLLTFALRALGSELNSTSSIPLSILSWRLVDFTEVPDNRTGILQVTFKSEGSRNKRYFKSKGYVSLTFSFSTRNSHASHPPHIFSYAGLSVLVDFTVTRLIDEYASAPLSLQAAFFAANESLAGGEEFRASRVTTINDELTPGVFEVGPFSLIVLSHQRSSDFSVLASCGNPFRSTMRLIVGGGKKGCG